MNVAPIVLICDKSGELVQGSSRQHSASLGGPLSFSPAFLIVAQFAAPPSITSHGASQCSNAGNVEALSMADRQRLWNVKINGRDVPVIHLIAAVPCTCMSVVCRKSIVSMRRCVVDVLHDGVEGEWDELSWGRNLGLHIQERKFITSHVQPVRALLAEM
jgi:hypothetical protein